MNALTLAAGTYWDDAGRLADRDLELTPEGPWLQLADPGRVFVTGHAPDGAFVTVQVDRDTLPPEKAGDQREACDPADSYQAGDPVWVWSAESRAWCIGAVTAASRIAVQVRYEPTGQRGTATNTVAPGYVARRTAAQAAETSPAPPG